MSSTNYRGVLDVEATKSDEVAKSFKRDLERSVTEDLNRSLSTRLINMIAMAGIIGTGLFLGTGKTLAAAGPLSMLLCYAIIGGIVYLTMLSLGEMATLIPVSGSFTTYAKRFGSESFGFAILANYWFNDAISVASDLTALQIVMEYWTDFHAWIVALIFWVFLLFLNVFHVRFYGETEYWLATLKLVTIIIFFIVSIIVNAGKNPQHEYIGFKYWSLGDAPFVNGFRGFASCFVTASFAFGGVESIMISGGELKNPVRSTPKIVKIVWIRIFVFYVLAVFFIGMNVPYNYPSLSTGGIITSPFTIVFQMAGAKAAGSFMNAVIMTSVISAGNHALFAGSRLAFTLGTQGYFPKFITRTNRWKIPYVAVLLTWIAGGLAFGASFIGAGTLWTWLQCIVGVSNQFAWLCIGITSIRFRQGLAKQNKTHLLKFKNWTHPWGPWVVVVLVTFIIFVQGWSAFAPWDVSAFFQSYLEVGVFPFTFIVWWVIRKGKDRFVKSKDMDFETDQYVETQEEKEQNAYADSLTGWAKFKYNFVDNFL
ncbi:hypothetical protein CANTEDRAFT_98074 [Yamadazyma tenuis ATCC 10573]|uniref:Amino acid permease/ SLC12A domain-containing protein n=1 Tax=Candida tenuis (strain ATCC 10573 / BCRC 21748 / CBS 615 / JCM 9827 / NBRC 10315 / NRRL Y-1498 / VKM Y-70) TaxID=590646 RepID=G3B355_CANTC|nr:uncharacterized protein CANTEDRAFT_98074 [Yamadazyma tenuis ATCC 10573]EGV64084.1 hypothetical protein CANTEDRAFT_98074 [Yamadazyma tenuis ATCC 10573]